MQINLVYIIIYTSIMILFLVLLYWYLIQDKLIELIKTTTISGIDQLTGLKNRFVFNKKIDCLIEKAKEDENKGKKSNPFAFVFIDLDGFKQINDQLGYNVGDMLLNQFGKKLESNFTDNTEVFRIGGDEFALIIKNITTKKKLETLLNKLHKNMLEPIETEEISNVVEHSIGVAIFPTDADTREDLLACADIAITNVKENGKNGICFNTPLLIKNAENKFKMEQSIKDSFKKGHFEVDFQPRFGLKEKNKLWLVSLVYWDHPTLGKLKADYFIKYIEDLGLITDLDELTLRKTCAKLKYFDEQGISDVNIAINISIKQLKRHDFVDRICTILSKYSKYADKITLEINNLIDVKNIEMYKLMMEKLKKYGVKISINNFEIIYDSLAQLNNLPIDELKINCEFLKQKSLNKEILEYIVKIANTLGYKTTLIGIENQAEYDYAQSIGVDKIQGNYISKVIDPENMLDNIRKYIKK
ncbi:MAG: EAL domain-containing protein [Clostridia bacterium]